MERKRTHGTSLEARAAGSLGRPCREAGGCREMGRGPTGMKGGGLAGEDAWVLMKVPLPEAGARWDDIHIR